MVSHGLGTVAPNPAHALDAVAGITIRSLKVKQLHIAPDLALPLDAVTQTFAIMAKRGVGKTLFPFGES